VVYGHPFETPDAGAELEWVNAIYRSDLPSPEVLHQLQDRSIDFVYLGPRERAIANPTWMVGLTPVYAEADVTIYRIATMRRLLQGRTLILPLLAAAAALFLLPLASGRQPSFPPGTAARALIAHLTARDSPLDRSVGSASGIRPYQRHPFAADPLSGCGIAFWALAVLPEAIVFNLILWIHLVFGGYGFFSFSGRKARRGGGTHGFAGFCRHAQTA
jgi:hypothetical protein